MGRRDVYYNVCLNKGHVVTVLSKREDVYNFLDSGDATKYIVQCIVVYNGEERRFVTSYRGEVWMELWHSTTGKIVEEMTRDERVWFLLERGKAEMVEVDRDLLVAYLSILGALISSARENLQDPDDDDHELSVQALNRYKALRYGVRKALNEG